MAFARTFGNSDKTILVSVELDIADVEVKQRELDSALSRLEQKAARGQRVARSGAELLQRSIERAAAGALADINRIPSSVTNAANQAAEALKRVPAAAQRAAEQAQGSLRQLSGGFDQVTQKASSFRSAIGGIGGVLGGLAGIGIGAAFQQIGSAALQAAIDIDKNRQTITALVGSTDAANRKLAELRQLAARTPGLTASVATDAYAALKAAGDIAEQTINRFIAGAGRLNAVFSIDNFKDFSRNILQIFKQGFEVGDIKEALGRIPVFDEILKQAFGTNNPEALRRLKDAGKLTLDGYLQGISGAIENNPALANVQESIGSRFEKARDNILFALAPLGDEIANVILPLLTRIGGGAGEMGNVIAAELRRSRDEFFALADSAAYFGGAITNALGKGIGVGFDLKKELRDLRGIVDFVTGGVVSLQDIFELFGATARGAVQSVALVIESALAGALSLIGVKIEALEKDMKRLGFGIADADARISAGLKNTAAFYNRNATAPTGVVEAGNAVPVNLSTGRPVNPADYQPFRAAAGAAQSALGGGRSGGAGASWFGHICLPR